MKLITLYFDLLCFNIMYRTELPKMLEADVRMFIKTGQDPLVEHVRRMEEAPHKMKELLRLVTRKKARCKPFLLFRSLSAKDMIQCIFEVIEKSIEAKKNKVKGTLEKVQKQKVLTEHMAQMAVGKRKKTPGSGGTDPAVSGSGDTSMSAQKKMLNRSISAFTSNDSSATNVVAKVLNRSGTLVKDSGGTSTPMGYAMNRPITTMTGEGELTQESHDMGHAFPLCSSEQDQPSEIRHATPPKSEKPSATRPKRR